MEDFVSLKCPNCGASNFEDAGNNMIRCSCCGSTQARSDAKKYMDQAKAEILSEISKLIPVGFNLSQTENMDPVARHNIFQNSIKSSIESQLREYRFEYVSALNNQLIALPFRVVENIPSKYGTKQLYMFNEKVKSVSSLAVDDNSQSIINNASAIAISYATVLNNITLLTDVDSDRYLFMANNFKISSDVLKQDASFGIIRSRFDALAVACEGFDDLMKGHANDAKLKLENAKMSLSDAKNKASSSLDYGAMVSSISRELVIIETGLLIATSLSVAPHLDAPSFLISVKNFIDEISIQEKRFASVGGQWSVVLKRAERYNELFAEFSNIVGAKTGQSTLRVANGTGQFYIPMWVIDLKYSFITGSLFKKKAVQVTDTVLVSAMFLTDEETFMNPKLPVTDIFGFMPESTFMQRVKGEETSITMGGSVKNLVDQSAIGPISADSKVIMPVTTKQEAEILCKEYVEGSRDSHPKLTMGNPVAKYLIYVPCNIDGSISLSVNLK